jgi:hypothetical protein
MKYRVKYYYVIYYYQYILQFIKLNFIAVLKFNPLDSPDIDAFDKFIHY